jgi:hypothetical protein
MSGSRSESLPVIPASPEELSCDWLTNALREGGVLREARVAAVEQEVLGVGEGFMGRVVRLHLDLDRPEPEVPSKLIAKIPTDLEENRAIGELLGAYEREILFYTDLAAGLPLRTPRVYYSAMDGSRTSKSEASMAAMLDRWPMWLIRWMMVLVTWIARRRGRRYVLLVEDLSPGESGDQVAGCSAADARHVLAAIAKVHASYWNSPFLSSAYWLRRQDLNPRTMHSMFLRNLPSFSERFRPSAPASFATSLEWLEKRAVELLRALYASTPETLLHCDLRLDNIMFPPVDRRDPDSIGFFDWQLTGRGPGTYDVAYFLSGALGADVPAEVELDLLRGYHEDLVANGVRDYAFDECLRDYRRALLAVLHRISSTDTMELGEGRGVDLIEAWLSRTLARLRDVDLDSLLAPRG